MAITTDADALLLKSRDLGGASGALIEVDVARAGWEFTGLTVMRALRRRIWRTDLDHRRTGEPIWWPTLGGLSAARQ
jgi:hypothetical protein